MGLHDDPKCAGGTDTAQRPRAGGIAEARYTGELARARAGDRGWDTRTGEHGLPPSAGRDLSPPPGNLAWLSQMPMAQWDPFMYWTVAEGGAEFGSAMPAFKDTLFRDDIWAVIAYIQARLPQKAK